MIKITPASFQLEDDPDLFLPVNFSSSMTEFPLPGVRRSPFCTLPSITYSPRNFLSTEWLQRYRSSRASASSERSQEATLGSLGLQDPS